jgi:hypothetical protein
MRSGGTLAALRLGEQVAKLVAQLRPQALIVTFEGHSWERVAFAAARNIQPDIRCIGYQHAALFNLQHAIQRSLGPAYDADLILTSGTYAKERLEKNNALRHTRISALGSTRSVQSPPTTINKKANACVVLPEGIESECDLLFEFSLRCAALRPDIEFIWRLHPSMNHEALVGRNTKLRNPPANVTLSRAPIEEDLAHSQWALYRGSTAVLQAVAAGVCPVYLAQPDEISIDPLHEFASWRSSVVTEDEFQSALDAQNAEVWSKLRDACLTFYTPLKLQALLDYLAQPTESIN